MEQNPILSVIIVNYNVRYFLEQCLHSVHKAIIHTQNINPDWKIDVYEVDNDSKDGSQNMVSSQFPWVKLIDNKINVGFSVANNQAINDSKAKYVLLLNPDTIIPEDCFSKTLEYMEQNPETGGLGVKMIDGGGNFLPESKRGLPTPSVSFYKITGLSKIFSKSKKFGAYHLKYLPENQINEIDVLAGAFMLMRKSVLNKIGNLDETFFMYGEDIDLSYRIQLSGFKNIYFPESTIIHYKGESTKKGSMNYVKVFYNAMKIFAEKHFSGKKSATFSTLINIGIKFKIFSESVKRIINIISLPFIEFSIQWILMFVLIKYWESTIKYLKGGYYPSELLTIHTPIYILFWMMGLLLSGAYFFPFRINKTIRGVGLGALALFVVYALLPESLRYSRAILIIGTGLMLANSILIRLLATKLVPKEFRTGNVSQKRILFIGSSQEGNRIISLLEKIKLEFENLGIISPIKDDISSVEVIGDTSQIDELIKLLNPNELIFLSKDMDNKQIIDWIEIFGKKYRKSNMEFKIVPPNSDFVIGSNSKNRPGDYYTLADNFKISTNENIYFKRLMDIILGFFTLLISPILLIFGKSISKTWKISFQTIFGKKSMVGYINNNHQDIPKIKSAIFSHQEKFSTPQVNSKLDYNYAKHYHPSVDLKVYFKKIFR